MSHHAKEYILMLKAVNLSTENNGLICHCLNFKGDIQFNLSNKSACLQNVNLLNVNAKNKCFLSLIFREMVCNIFVLRLYKMLNLLNYMPNNIIQMAPYIYLKKCNIYHEFALIYM